MTPDTLTRMELHLWAALECTHELTALVRLQNRLRTTGGYETPARDGQSTSALPELRIEPEGGAINLPGALVSSNSHGLVQTYRIELKTDESRTGSITRAEIPRTINRIKLAIVLGVNRFLMRGTNQPGLEGLRVMASSFGDGREANNEQAPGRAGWQFVTQISFSVPLDKAVGQ